MIVCGITGGILIRLGQGAKGKNIFRREAIAVVGLSWIMAMVLGAMPFWISQTSSVRTDDGQMVRMGIADGLFESASGFSGTGATVLTNLEDPEMVPAAQFLFWRSETPFFGRFGDHGTICRRAGDGLGRQGADDYRNTRPQPRDHPSSASQRAARSFAYIFIGLTVILSIILAFEGMTVFDAMAHAFGTIATGGFSTHNKSIEFFS